MKIGTSDDSVSNQSVNHISQKGGTKFSDIFKAASSELQMPSNSAAKSAGTGVTGSKAGSDAVITNMELYNSLIKKYGTEQIPIIAKELVYNDAVNVENIDPNHCTELELKILEYDYARHHTDGKMSVLDGFHANIARIQDRYRGTTPGFDEKVDWVQKIKDMANELAQSGMNEDFIKNGSYDALIKYLDELTSYAKGEKE